MFTPFSFTLIYICRAKKNLLFIFFCKTLKIKEITYFLIVKRLNIKDLITFFKNGEISFQNFRTFLILF